MKVAFIMSGDTRHFWLALPSILKYAIKPNNADVFVYVNKDSCCNYNGSSPRKVAEEEIFTDCFKGCLKEFRFPDVAFFQERDHLVKRYIKRTKDYTSDSKMVWYHNDPKKALYLIDEWLKLRECSRLIKNYDIIVRVRPDIIWTKPIDFRWRNDGLHINYDQRGECLWPKDYIFCGSSDLIKGICEEHLEFLGSDLMPCIYGDDDMTLSNEIQFGKYLMNSKIKLRQLKSRERDISRQDIKLTGKEPYYYVYNGLDNIVNNYVEG